MKLYPFQKQIIKDSERFKSAAYYLDMGLGKTFVGSKKAIKNGNNILLICQKSKINDWIEHFKNFLPVYNLTNKKEIPLFLNSDFESIIVGVINYDLVFRRKELLNLKFFTIILDESSLIQNEKSKRAKAVLKMKCKTNNFILLSGTCGTYEKLWSQLYLLGWDISKKAYDKTYCNYVKTDWGSELDKNNPYKNVERLKFKMKQYGCFFLKTDEVLDLPEQNFINVKIPNTKQYRKFSKDKIIDMPNGLTLLGDTPLNYRLSQRKLCSYYNDNKLNALSDILDSTDKRVVIFYNFKNELLLIVKELKCKYGYEKGEKISVVNGETKDLTAYNNHSDSILLVQYQAGAMGLNLQKANVIVYFSPTDKWQLWQQSQKRIHRIGSTKPCFYYKLIVENSVEENIYEAVESDVDYNDYLYE